MNTFKLVSAILYTLILFFISGLLSGCSNTTEKSGSAAETGSLRDSAVTYNQQLVKSEIQEINDFITRYRWQMLTTSTGLRYMIYREGNGAPPKQGDVVSIRYTTTLLNGNIVQQSAAGLPFTFELGKGKVVNGLDEGILLLKTGSRAKFIVPSHLAFGLLGDMEKVPERAVLVYDVELCAVSHP